MSTVSTWKNSLRCVEANYVFYVNCYLLFFNPTMGISLKITPMLKTQRKQ